MCLPLCCVALDLVSEEKMGEQHLVVAESASSPNPEREDSSSPGAVGVQVDASEQPVRHPTSRSARR